MTRRFSTSLCLALALLGGCATAPVGSAAARSPVSYSDFVEQLDFSAFSATFADSQVDSILKEQGRALPDGEQRAAATLIEMGAITADDLGKPRIVERKLAEFVDVMTHPHPALYGRVGDPSLLSRLSEPLDYAPLLAANKVLESLGDALSTGVITGYDLRRKGVYDGFPAERTFIYSQSSLLHLRQLVTLMRREGVAAWVYVTPKISAFLYREEWGNGGNQVVTLPSGVKVVQGREMAVLFRFLTSSDREKFNRVVLKYAKRDSKTEEGLIASAWWQPFYYSDAPLIDFAPIGLVVVDAGQFEATLTVLQEKTDQVVAAMTADDWPLRVEKVWVNPSFHRFLQGDFK